MAKYSRFKQMIEKATYDKKGFNRWLLRIKGSFDAVDKSLTQRKSKSKK